MGKIGTFSKKIKKRHYNNVLIIKIHVFAKFHQEIMISDDIRGYLVILPFSGLRPEIVRILFEKAIQFEVEVLHTPNFHRTRLIK